MKTCCKNIDPTDLDIIKRFITECISDKLVRKDYSRFVASYCEYSSKEIRKFVYEFGYAKTISILKPAIISISLDIQKRIVTKNLNLSPVKYDIRKDGMSGKIRVIGIEPIMQQLIEHVAVGCMEELWNKKICYFQCASIDGKGQLFGAKAIRKWTIAKETKYFVKRDVSKCFPSIKHEICLKFLQRDIGKNKTLLWLVEELLKNHGDGLIIGSLLSQFLCNYLLSYAYRYVSDLYKIRRGKRVRLVAHVLFFMDDILITGNDARNLKIASNLLEKFMNKELNLKLKDNWEVKDHSKANIDMMGYVIRNNGKIKIRRKVFIRARRSLISVYKGKASLRQSKRSCAYYGYFKHTKIIKLKLANGSTIIVKEIKARAAAVISEYDRRIIKCKTLVYHQRNSQM